MSATAAATVLDLLREAGSAGMRPMDFEGHVARSDRALAALLRSGEAVRVTCGSANSRYYVTGLQPAGALLLALRTGMRAGELVGMRWALLGERSVRLPQTKNGTARDVPLSRKAARLIERARGLHDDLVLPVGVQSLDALFRRARDAAGIEGLRWHDSRHTAATRIGATVGQPGRLSFPEFVAMFGWRDPRNAMIYVNPSAQALAGKLD